MLCRKLFKFEGSHIVRNCSSERCAWSIHGHSYKVELFLGGSLDNGLMVYDFGLLKTTMKELVDSFDHAITIWGADGTQYVEDMKRHSDRWITVPFNPSAEAYALFFLLVLDRLITRTIKQNGETNVHAHSVIVHETDTGYARADRSDIEPILFQEAGIDVGRKLKLAQLFDLSQVEFSDSVRADWSDPDTWSDISGDSFTPFQNPAPFDQVELPL